MDDIYISAYIVPGISSWTPDIYQEPQYILHSTPAYLGIWNPRYLHWDFSDIYMNPMISTCNPRYLIHRTPVWSIRWTPDKSTGWTPWYRHEPQLVHMNPGIHREAQDICMSPRYRHEPQISTSWAPEYRHHEPQISAWTPDIHMSPRYLHEPQISTSWAPDIDIMSPRYLHEPQISTWAPDICMSPRYRHHKPQISAWSPDTHTSEHILVTRCGWDSLLLSSLNICDVLVSTLII